MVLHDIRRALVLPVGNPNPELIVKILNLAILEMSSGYQRLKSKILSAVNFENLEHLIYFYLVVAVFLRFIASVAAQSSAAIFKLSLNSVLNDISFYNNVPN